MGLFKSIAVYFSRIISILSGIKLEDMNKILILVIPIAALN